MLLDIEMPRMDGYELATAMKADPRMRDVPIIMITSRTGDKHRQRALKLEIGVASATSASRTRKILELMRNVFDADCCVGNRALGAAPAGQAARPFQAEMDALSLQVAAMPDVPQSRPPASSSAPGAVVIAAGVGGPDAVRQLLGGLPPQFPRPVVLRQRIEGGQYDKLVRQMQRAAQMPVALAQAGDVLQPGTVYVLADGLDLQAAPAGLVFAPADGEPTYAALRAEDSALLLLSGADVALLDQAMAMRWAGGLVVGQSADHCFDPAASNALVARGGEALGLAQLAQKLLQRWPA
jgi:chemosensory pili system protein ChpB (putative protein-glutamate methylesterase)